MLLFPPLPQAKKAVAGVLYPRAIEDQERNVVPEYPHVADSLDNPEEVFDFQVGENLRILDISKNFGTKPTPRNVFLRAIE